MDFLKLDEQITELIDGANFDAAEAELLRAKGEASNAADSDVLDHVFSLLVTVQRKQTATRPRQGRIVLPIVVGDETLFLERLRARAKDMKTIAIIRNLARTLWPVCRDQEFKARLQKLTEG
jgi:hypothetical protein